jgi:hypothetical protein
MRVLALDVPRILDEDTLIRPKPLKADLGENVNTLVEAATYRTRSGATRTS